MFYNTKARIKKKIGRYYLLYAQFMTKHTILISRYVTSAPLVCPVFSIVSFKSNISGLSLGHQSISIPTGCHFG